MTLTIPLLFGTLFLFVFIGIPIAFSIGLASLVTLFLTTNNVSLTLVITQMFSGMNSFTLMAIPFFILAGDLMNRVGLTEKILNFAEALVGHIKGSLAQVNIVASMFMAGVSGSGTADVAAMGSAMIPAMKKKGYDTDFTVVLTAVASVVGPIIPPSILFILYGALTNVSVAKLFIGGIIPGVLMGLGMMITAYIICRKRGYEQEKKTFDFKNITRNSKDGIIAMIVPFIIIGSIITGIATATESGVVAVFAAIILGLFIFRTLKSPRDLGEVVNSTVSTTAMVFMILATSAVFSNILVRAHFQDVVLNILNAFTNSPFQMLIAIVIFVLIIGLFVDVTPILVMFAAPFAMIGNEIGYDPVFFGVVLVISAMIGSVTPPVGTLLFISSSIGRISIDKTFKVLLPFLLTLVTVLFIILLFPSIITFLPNLLLD